MIIKILFFRIRFYAICAIRNWLFYHSSSLGCTRVVVDSLVQVLSQCSSLIVQLQQAIGFDNEQPYLIEISRNII